MRPLALALALCASSASADGYQYFAPIELELVHDIVQERVTYVSDGQGDWWRPAVTKGDCEDFALAKRLELLKLGYQPYRLQILFAHSPGELGHAVLLVDGKWVLDNGRKDVVAMSEWTKVWRVKCIVTDISDGPKVAADRC